MTPLLVLLLAGALVGYLAALLVELRRDGYGTRPGPRPHAELSHGGWPRL